MFGITDDERQPIVIGEAVILPPEQARSARLIARDAIENFKATENRRNRRRQINTVVGKIQSRFGTRFTR